MLAGDENHCSVYGDFFTDNNLEIIKYNELKPIDDSKHQIDIAVVFCKKDILTTEVESIKNDRVKLLGFISNNEEISKINITGGNLIELPEKNGSYQEAKEIFAKIYLMKERKDLGIIGAEVKKY